MRKLLGLLDAVGMAATNLSAQMRPATPMIYCMDVPWTLLKWFYSSPDSDHTSKSSTVNSGSIQAAIKNPPK